MATLLIEGDPWAIQNLAEELGRRDYLTSDFRWKTVEFNALPVEVMRQVCEQLAQWNPTIPMGPDRARFQDIQKLAVYAIVKSDLPK